MKIYYIQQRGTTKLFGSKFIEKNKNKLKIIINNKIFPLIEEFSLNNTNKPYIKLIKLGNIFNLSNLFSGCDSLQKILDSSKEKNKREENIIIKDIIQSKTDIINQSFVFKGNISLSPIFNLNSLCTSENINLKGIFNGCSSLESLPDISGWNTNNVYDMSYMFNKCKSL